MQQDTPTKQPPVNIKSYSSCSSNKSQANISLKKSSSQASQLSPLKQFKQSASKLGGGGAETVQQMQKIIKEQETELNQLRC